MRRKRFQKGSVRPRKHGRNKVWVAQWSEDGAKRSKVLGPCADLTKGQAEALLSQILHPINAQAGHMEVPKYSFGLYVEKVFLPAVTSKWKASTRATSEADIRRYLLPEFGQKLMGSITRDHMQTFLQTLASNLRSSIVGHLRWHLNAIFKMASSDGLINGNPAAALFTPPCKQSDDKRVMSGAEVMAALGILDVRERLILRMAAFDGMRPGEIFAIRLGKIGDGHVSIEERVYSGVFDTPKGRRGKKTSRVVALAPGTTNDLQLWLALLGGRSADDFLFPSEAGITPLRPNNLWKSRVRPRLQLIGLDWVNFQVLRRTNASLARKANVDDKVAADQRGHTLGVSMEVYATSDLEQKIEAVNKLELEVTRAASIGDRQTPKIANSSDSLRVS